MNMDKRYSIGILATHPIQYYIPWYRKLAGHPEINLKVFYCHRQSPQDQARAGFDVAFDWDIPLLDGYAYQFLVNKSRHPNVYTFFGCDTPEIMRIISHGSFDAFIVHGWNVLSFWQAMLACFRMRTPVMVRGDSQLLTRRSLLKRVFKYLTYPWFVRKFAAYLVVGKRAEEYYLHYGADKKKMFNVCHCVDNDFFACARAALESQRWELRRSWGIPEDSVVFLFAGKLIPKKRPDDFLKALKIACNHSQGIFGLVVGDGPLRRDLEDFSGKVNLPVAFVGFLNQREITKAYTASDVLVLPSDARETWGLVVNEAFACRIPAIVSDAVGCAPDLILPGETGEVFHCGDVGRCAEIFKDFAINSDYAKEMGSNAYKLIMDYSLTKATLGTLAAIQAVVKNG